MKVNSPKQIVEEYESNIKNFKSEEKSNIDMAEILINISISTLVELRKWVVKNDFKDKPEEINFFKNVKPKIHSEFLFYHELFRIENKRKYSTVSCQLECLNKELAEIQNFIGKNKEFYHYYTRGLSDLDEKYFTRGNINLVHTLDAMHFLIDEKFSTGYDITLSKFMANEKLAGYLKSEIEELEYLKANGIPQKGKLKSNLNWTETKAALIELIYALHSTGAINNGASDIKKLANTFEKTFNIELGDYYRKFLEIRNRKIDRTKFLDLLKNSLIQRMNNADK